MIEDGFMHLFFDRIECAIGPIRIASDGRRLLALDFAGYETRMDALLRKHHGPFARTDADDPNGLSTLLRAYLAGDLAALGQVAVHTGGTPFQREVWAALGEIAPGTTTTYGALAARLGRPKASRAVGMAVGQNPVGIVVPCHRVIGAGAALTGYAGGLERKRWLLEHEGALPRTSAPSRRKRVALAS